MEETGKLLVFKKKEKCPPELEWAQPLVEHQKTQSFKDIIGYEIAVAMQRAQKRHDNLTNESLEKS